MTTLAHGYSPVEERPLRGYATLSGVFATALGGGPAAAAPTTRLIAGTATGHAIADGPRLAYKAEDRV